MNYETQPYSLIVKPKNEPIYSEMATIIRIDDEAAGPFVVVEQHGREEVGKIAIDWEEWPHIREAIDRLMVSWAPEKPKAVYLHPGRPDCHWDGKGEKPQWMKNWIAAGNDPMECLAS